MQTYVCMHQTAYLWECLPITSFIYNKSQIVYIINKSQRLERISISTAQCTNSGTIQI